MEKNEQNERDLYFLGMAVELALKAEQEGNLPVGAVLVLDDEVIAEGPNALLIPDFHPGKHAEMQALANVPVHLWPRAGEMTCYTTLEPCVMCCGSMLLHGIGRVVYGAIDPEGGSSIMLEHLPPYYQKKENGKKRVFDWHGPLLSDVCDPLYKRAAKRFDELF